jgi:hypothetical protein
MVNTGQTWLIGRAASSRREGREESALGGAPARSPMCGAASPGRLLRCPCRKTADLHGTRRSATWHGCASLGCVLFGACARRGSRRREAIASVPVMGIWLTPTRIIQPPSSTESGRSSSDGRPRRRAPPWTDYTSCASPTNSTGLPTAWSRPQQTVASAARAVSCRSSRLRSQ